MATVQTIIVHHRGKSMLECCLGSLLDSRGVEMEIIVVANGCREELPSIVAGSPRIRLVESEAPIGFAAANNLGVAWGREHLGVPDFYYFLNNDTQSFPDSLARLIAALRCHPRAAVAGPRLLILGAPDYLNSLGLQITEDAWGWDEGIGQRAADYGPLPATRPVLAVTGSALLMAAATFREVGGWTEIYDYYFEDVDLCIKAWEAGYEVIHVPEAVVLHRISATMTEGSERKYYLFWRNRLMLGIIHWPRALLVRLLRRAVIDEILRRRRAESLLQRRALSGALRRLPGLVRERRRLRRRHHWRRFLHPPGSVPVITLPAAEAAAPATRPADPAPAAAATLPQASWKPAAERMPRPGGKRVLVLGCSPLPFENQQMNYAPGIRTWQFARPLAEAGHAVCVACLQIPGACDEETPGIYSCERDGALIFSLRRDLFEAADVLPGLVAEFAPEVLVGATALPSRRAVQLAGERPVWVDLFGDLMAEAQAKAQVGGHDDLSAYVDLLMELLARGDAFSAVSERQRYAVIGQLGLSGRLNRATCGRELVHTVPCSSGGFESVAAAGPPELAASDFVILWSGGFNTWCDVETLFRALEAAMAEHSGIRFVATGGEIKGHDEQTCRRFVRLVESSAFGARFLLKGRLPAAEMSRYLARADLGVVTEKPIYERELGSSGRLAHWLAQGLPLICTELSELGRTIAAAGLGMTYPPGDHEALARLILAAAAAPDRLRRYAEAGRRFADREQSFHRTTLPLAEWVARAEPLPDLGRPELRGRVAAPARVAELEARLGDLEARTAQAQAQVAQAQARATELEQAYHEVVGELGKIHQSKTWRWWMRYLALRRGLAKPLALFRRRSQR